MQERHHTESINEARSRYKFHIKDFFDIHLPMCVDIGSLCLIDFIIELKLLHFYFVMPSFSSHVRV